MDCDAITVRLAGGGRPARSVGVWLSVGCRRVVDTNLTVRVVVCCNCILTVGSSGCYMRSGHLGCQRAAVAYQCVATLYFCVSVLSSVVFLGSNTAAACVEPIAEHRVTSLLHQTHSLAHQPCSADRYPISLHLLPSLLLAGTSALLPAMQPVVSDSSGAGSTSSAHATPSNLELKPDWPLFSPDRTAVVMFSGIPRFVPPPASASILEPAFTPADLQLIQQLRADARAHLQQHGITQPDAYPLKNQHWRDIYNANRHRTTVVATPDPRLTSAYQAPPIQTEWPDYLLHQFLVARKRKLDKATRMLLDYVYWWNAFGMDDLCAQPVCPFAPEVAAFYPERMHGVDKDGRPFVIGWAGGIDLDAYAAVALPIEVAYVIQAYKRELIRRACLAASARCGRRITNVTVVTSLNGFLLAHRVGIPWVRNQAYIDSFFYPETAGQRLKPHTARPSAVPAVSYQPSHPSVSPLLPLAVLCLRAGQVIVLSAPSIFAWFWAILKGFIDEKTQEKISILGSDYADTVIARIGRDNTPVEWTGGCTLCGGHCMPIVAARDTAAEARRQAEVVRRLESGDGAVRREVTLAARAEHEEKLTVQMDPSTPKTAAADNSEAAAVSVYTVWWSIAVRSKDVDFSVHFTPNTGDAYTVKAVERIAAGSGGAEDGRVRGCAAVHVGAQEGGGGVVRLTFSNGFSMFSSKTVEYKVGVRLQEDASQ